MIKHKNIYGVDISKDYFDVVCSDGSHNQYLNDGSGFTSFKNEMAKRSLVVMESTGYYHHRLAEFLAKEKVRVAVVNPISVKRFSQMKLSKIKTDKADAQTICDYAAQYPVRPYRPKSKRLQQCHQLFVLADLYQKQRTALKNKLKGERSMGSPSATVIDSIERNIDILTNEITAIELEIDTAFKKLFPGQRSLLTGIPGIGRKTARYLMLSTDGFKRFESTSQLCCYAGTTPTIRRSGSSIRGKSRISKMGNPTLRKLLFLCSFTARKTNAACRGLFERITEKGKCKKLALVAVCNKLLKQAFAIVTNGTPYSEAHINKPLTIKTEPAYETTLT